MDALTARLQGGGYDREERRNCDESRNRHNSESWADSHKPPRETNSHRGPRENQRDMYELSKRGEEGGKGGRDRDLLLDRKKVEKSGRTMSGLPNQGDRSRRPRTPLGSPTRRTTVGDRTIVGEGSGYHVKDRGTDQSRRNSSYSKNYYAP